MNATIIIPAKNEEATIKEVVEGAKKYGRVVAVVSKKSSDETLSLAKSCGIETVIDNGGGKGEALRSAIKRVEEGVIVFMDADGSHTSADIPKLVKPLAEGKADLVIGSRFLGGSEELSGDLDKFLRMLFSLCIAEIINLRFKTALQDTQNGFRAIKTEVAKNLNLKADGFDIETEITMKCLKKGYKILEVPSKELKRKHGKSGISITKMGWKYAWRVLINLL